MPQRKHYFARIPTIALLVLLGLAPWLPLPLIGGALLAVSAGIMEEVLE